MRSRPLLLATLTTALVMGCGWDGLRENPQPNESPSVRITGGAANGSEADYRVEFYWFGSDPDGTVSHFLYAIDDTCLCRFTETVDVIDEETGETTTIEVPGKSNDPAVCIANGVEPLYDSPDSLWRRIDTFSGSFAFEAADDERPGVPPTASQWHSFFIKAIDNRGAESPSDMRFFNAVTIAPTARILQPVGSGSEKLASVSTFLNVRWSGRDEDAVNPDKLPVGYQLKLIGISETEGLSSDDAPILRKLIHSLPPTGWSAIRERNLLIPDSLAVPEPQEAGVEFPPLPTPEHYYETDWWPKLDAPYPSDRIQLRNLAGPRFYAIAIRAVDQAGAVSPDRVLLVRDEENIGNVLKLFVDPLRPVNPHLTVRERNFLGIRRFTAPGEEWRVEVPVNVELDFEWTQDASWYGAEEGNMNFALDIPDPECEVCGSDNGIGGWIGWGNSTGFKYTFTEEDAGQSHVLYIKARDESDRADREIIASIIMEVIPFSFDRTAVLIDDFTASGINDCDHDNFIRPIVRHAVEDHLELGEELFLFDAALTPRECVESTNRREMELSYLSRFKTLYWNVAPGGLDGSLLGNLTDQSPTAEFGKYLSIYVRAGGNLIVWGRQTIGALLGDFYLTSDAYVPELPQFDNPNFGPGSFVWDIMRFRTKFDRAPRGTVTSLLLPCSGIVALRPSARAIAEEYPLGIPDPTGYDPERVAIWHDSWNLGRKNTNGGLISAPDGAPPLITAGLDTLYTMTANAWAWERAELNPDYDPDDPDSPQWLNLVQDVCLTPFGSKLENQPVVMRYRNPDPESAQGRIVWLGFQLYAFREAEAEDGSMSRLMKEATDWVFGVSP